MISLIFFAGMGILVYLRRLPLIVMVGYLLISCVAFYLYGHDKLAARKGRWRTRESTLHILGVLGGWPGALLAQRIFRHKSRKSSFQVLFWLSVVGNCAALVYWVHL